ncbi:MAG: hypothetical protein CMJ78_18710 [Planctomycetaceae bacterium]|nr:hypothetical protein [Planctomycetaceae bacterium]
MGQKTELTARQTQVYNIIKDCILSQGYGPTVREIGEQTGIRSPNGVMCHLTALEKKGWIKRTGKLSRSIQLTDNPTDALITSCKEVLKHYKAGRLQVARKASKNEKDKIEAALDSIKSLTSKR